MFLGIPMDLTDFTWHVCGDGNRWHLSAGDLPRWPELARVKATGLFGDEYEYELTDDLLLKAEEEAPEDLYVEPAGRTPRREYQPLKEHTGLFRTFAELEPTATAILNFADQYGLLWEEWSEDDEPPRVPSLYQWQIEAMTMSTCVSLWDAICTEDAGALRGNLAFKRKKAALSDDLWFEVDERLGNPQTRTTADSSVDAVGEHLGLILHRIVNLKGSARWHPKARDFSLVLEPGNLLEALWFQFLLAVRGQKAYVRCEVCSTWFERSLEAYRSDRVYCSDSCRFKAYRRRQSQARQMAREGKTIRQIARKLDSKTETIEGWLNTKKGEK